MCVRATRIQTWPPLCSASEWESCPQLGPERELRVALHWHQQTNVTSGNNRQSSSATLGSISWKTKHEKHKTAKSFLRTCPSRPILTGLPSFQGLYRCWTFWKLRSPLQIQSRWKTPPRALADKPGGRSHETWKRCRSDTSESEVLMQHSNQKINFKDNPNLRSVPPALCWESRNTTELSRFLNIIIMAMA